MLMFHIILLAVATAGMLAASKFVAKYNALGAYKVGQKLYKSSFIVMSISGIIDFNIILLSTRHCCF